MKADCCHGADYRLPIPAEAACRHSPGETCLASLKAMLDAAVVHPTGVGDDGSGAWTSNGFHASWSKACTRAGIVDVTFDDLRGTAVTLDARRMHRGRNRDDHRSQPARRALDPRRSLPQSRSRFG